MKILFCANIFESGIVGPARFAELILKINEIYPGRHEVRILTADVRSEQAGVYKMPYRFPRIIHSLDLLLRSYAFSRSIQKIRRKYPFDVVIFGNALYSLPARWLLPREIPVVGMINDSFSLETRPGNFRWSKVWFWRFLYRFVEKMTVRRLDLTLACSAYLRELILKEYGGRADRVKKLYQTIDVRRFPFVPRPIDAPDPVRVLFVKKKYRTGGLEDLAAALNSLSTFHFEVTIIGPWLQEEKRIKALFENSPHVRIRFRGPCSQLEVRHALQTHHLLCIPSRQEALGLALLEGLASGIPVVTTSAGGIPEVMDFGRNGWMALPGTPVDLARKIKACLDLDKTERIDMQEQARRFVREKFHFPVMLDQLLHLLEEQIPAK